MLKDIVLATVTPFDKQNKIDFKSNEKLLEFWRNGGINTFFICGTCGEMMSLSIDERKSVIDFYTERKKDNEHICVHIGGTSVQNVIELANYSQSKNADSVCIVTPNYYKISQEELIEYYRNILKNIPSKEVYLYNIPQCTGLDLLPESLSTLSNEFPQIAGIKYSFFDFNRIHKYLYVNPKKIRVLSGTDHMLVGLISSGVKGIISGIGCVYPDIFVNLLNAFKEHNQEKVMILQEFAIEIAEIMEYGYIPIFKESLAYKGFCEPYCRNPYQPMSDIQKKSLIEKLNSWEKRLNKAIN